MAKKKDREIVFGAEEKELMKLKEVLGKYNPDNRSRRV